MFGKVTPKRNGNVATVYQYTPIPHQNVPLERCSKLQLKLNGNYSSLREILAPSLRDHNGSLRAVNFSNGACATLREDEVLSFRALLLARCRREAVFGLGFLGFSDSRLLGSFGGFSASRLLGLFDGFSTSRLDSAQFLFCQQSSPWWPPVSVWPPAKVQSVQSALRGIWCYKVVLLVCESTIILLPVAGGHSGQEPLCLREACANLARNSLGNSCNPSPKPTDCSNVGLRHRSHHCV